MGGQVAYDKVYEILSSSDTYYTPIPYTREIEFVLGSEYKDKSPYWIKRRRISLCWWT